jgi:plasmid stability protein
MASITIHDVDEALQSRLRVQAGVHGRSMEDEARDILVSALGGRARGKGGLAASIRARFASLGGAEMPDVAREAMRAPPSFEE